MNASQNSKPEAIRAPATSTEFSFADWFVALIKRKKLVIALPVLFAVCAAVVSLFLPNIYKATTRILPREQTKSNAAAMLNQLGSMSGAGGALSIQIPIDPNAKVPIELYVSMLKSRSVADKLIQRFDLKKSYETELFDTTRQILAHNTGIKTGKDGLIVVEVEDKDPKRAADLTNAYIEELLKLTKTFAFSEASQRRLFFERQLQASRDKLADAEAVLKSATSRAAVGGKRNSTILDTIADLRAQIAAKEIQVSAMQAFVNVDTQDYNLVQQELGRMRAKIAELETAIGTPGKQTELDHVKAMHDVKYYETLYKLLEKQYETARIDELKDSSIIQVLDKAVQPERHFQPRRTLIVIGSALFGLLVAIFWVLLFDVAQFGKWRGRTEHLESSKS